MYLQLPVPITTNIVSSNPVDGEVGLIQHYVIKFVSDLRQVGGFFLGTPVSSNNETDLWDKAEIVLEVALKTITIFLQGHLSSHIILLGFLLFNL